MSRSRNGFDFYKNYLNAESRYRRLLRPTTDSVRTTYTDSELDGSSNKDDLLESQVRYFLIDPFLKALNWQVNPNQNEELNLIPEAQIQSEERNNRRFLDYLGISREINPLMIVETKRPNSKLPRIIGEAKVPNAQPVSEIISSALKKITDDRKEEDISEEWNKWLGDLKDYVKSTKVQKEVPRRVVMTNGNWLIIFKDPEDSFFTTGSFNPSNILVIDDFEKNYDVIYEHLEYQKVLNETPPLTLGEVSFYIASEEVNQVLFGLKLKYQEKATFIYDNIPLISVCPILFIGSIYNSWLVIENNDVGVDLPSNSENIGKHLDEVEKIAKDFLAKLNQNLNINIPLTPIESHFENDDAFEVISGVTYRRFNSTPEHDEFIIVTGQNTHFFKLLPSILNCPHNSSSYSNLKNVASPISIQRRSVKPRSYFVDGETHHCNHSEVEKAKISPITQINRNRCGLRSGRDSDPFCEIWKLETRLCCRTCIFENVCTKAQVFNLPCVK